MHYLAAYTDLRDLFAAHALSAMVGTGPAATPELRAKTAYEIADAMLEARKSTGGEGMSKKRIETGPIRFGDDWPGVFIRGDDALMYADFLHDYLKLHGDAEGEKTDLDRALILQVCKGLKETLEGCFVNPPEDGSDNLQYPDNLTNVVRWITLPSKPPA